MVTTWRVNDVVAFDVMQGRYQLLMSRFIERTYAAQTPEEDARWMAELARIRTEYLAVDGRDRAATDAHAAKIEEELKAYPSLTP